MIKNILPNVAKLNKLSSLKHSRFSGANLVVFATIFAAIGGYIIYSSFAAGFTTSFEAENSTKNSPAITVSDSNASGGSALKFAAGGTSSCALPKYPSPSCAGRLTGGNTFANTVSSYTASTTGQVIDNWHITGDLTVDAPNVTIKNSQIDGGVQNFRNSSSSFTLTDSTVGPASGCVGGVTVWGNNFTVLRVYSRNMENGISTEFGNVTVRDTYSTTCSPDSSAHADGFETCCDINAQIPNITLDHNTFEQRGATSATAPIDLAEALHVTNVQVTNNMVAGGAWSMYLENYTAPSPSTPKWVISGNKWVNNTWAFGAVQTSNTCNNLDWRLGNDFVTVDANYNILSTVQSNTPCVN
jgi:hypothetical protein